MFDGFEKQTDEQARKRLFASTGFAAVLCVIAGAVLIYLASRPKPQKKKEPIAVTFRKVAEAPKPAPKPKVQPKPKPAPKKKRSGKRSSKKVSKSAPSVPTEIPDEELAEGDESDFESDGEIPDSVGVGVAQSEPEPEPIVEEPKGEGGPIVMPERATPPRPRNTNRAPSYPEVARKKGVEGTVILKVVITEDGDVEKIKVLRGDEPFLAAALAVVRQWRYAPAVVDGEKVSVYRIIKVPFRLRRS
jgi:TonB family protein